MFNWLLNLFDGPPKIKAGQIWILDSEFRARKGIALRIIIDHVSDRWVKYRFWGLGKALGEPRYMEIQDLRSDYFLDD